MKLVNGSKGVRRVWTPVEVAGQRELAAAWMAQGLEPSEAASQLRKQYPGMGRESAFKVVRWVLTAWEAADDKLGVTKKRSAALRRLYRMWRLAMGRKKTVGKTEVADPNLTLALRIEEQIAKLEGTNSPEKHIVGSFDISEAMTEAIVSMSDDHMDEVFAEMADVYAAAAAFRMEKGDAMAGEYAKRALLLGPAPPRHQEENGSNESGGVVEDSRGSDPEQAQVTRGGGADARVRVSGLAERKSGSERQHPSGARAVHATHPRAARSKR